MPAIKPYSVQSVQSEFCANRPLRSLAMHQLKQMGWQCGQDYLIVGIGNDPTQSALAGMGISSFRLPTHALG